MEFIFSYEILFSFITLTFLEIILGIDNIIFIAIVVNNLPEHNRNKTRYIGISLALIIRIIALLMLSWILGMTKPLFTIAGLPFSTNNILLIVGGLFLIVKSVHEIYVDIYNKIGNDSDSRKHKIKTTFFGAVMQVAFIDFVFSFDSIITAIGVTKNIPVIVAAVVISMIFMLFSSSYLIKIIEKHPSLKIMALAFIFIVGVMLLADGLHIHLSKNYLYFALFFATFVEILNIIAKKR